MSAKLFDEGQVRLHWKVLGYDPMPVGCCAELRLVGDGSPRCLVVRDANELVNLLRTHMTSDTLAMLGVNPRDSAFAPPGKAADVVYVQTLFIDIDVDRAKGTNATEKQLTQLKVFREGPWVEKLKDLGLAVPPALDSGNGFHAYFGVPEVALGAHPDHPKKVAAFVNLLRAKLDHELRAAGARIDSTMDPARMAKLAGTAKPGRGSRVSGFAGTPARVEDPKLGDLVMTMDPAAAGPAARKARCSLEVPTRALGEENIPEMFFELVRTHPQIRKPWRGNETNIKDKTRSGQDLALVSRLLRLGLRDVGGLAAILFNTPHKKAREHSSPRDYIARTIATALRSAPAGLVPGTGLKNVVGPPEYLNPAQDFKDGLAYFAHKFVTTKTIELKKEKKTRKVKVETTKIITSDRCALTVQDPPRLGDEVALAEVTGTRFQVNKVQWSGGSRWRLSGSPYSLRPFMAGKAPRVDLRQFLPVLTGVFEEYIYFPDRGDHLLCALYVMLSYVYRLFLLFLQA